MGVKIIIDGKVVPATSENITRLHEQGARVFSTHRVDKLETGNTNLEESNEHSD